MFRFSARLAGAAVALTLVAAASSHAQQLEPSRHGRQRPGAAPGVGRSGLLIIGLEEVDLCNQFIYDNVAIAEI
ncbi:hypothetical protein [Bradyrhizobium japonicum]|uniref:hypothetical protein n=1 Tax=Bradyrhizobium japonicum TaxID=375 RepID=UPI0012BC82E9|nr:hypothetical protein [Bradyrhizobium japonicum]